MCLYAAKINASWDPGPRSGVEVGYKQSASKLGKIIEITSSAMQGTHDCGRLGISLSR